MPAALAPFEREVASAIDHVAHPGTASTHALRAPQTTAPVSETGIPPDLLSLAPTALALGLFRHGRLPPRQLLAEFQRVVETQWQRLGVRATYVAIDGRGYRGKCTKYGGRTHRRAMESGFDHVDVLAIVANPPDSDAPAFDSFADASLSFSEPVQTCSLCVSLNECFVRLSSPAFEDLLRELVDLSDWDYGYALAGDVDSKPECHVLEVDTGRLTPEEWTELNTWYGTPAEVRRTRLRGVYPFYVLNGEQLRASGRSDRSLRDCIESLPGSRLTPLSHGLTLWAVEDSARARSRADLSREGLLGVEPA